MFNVGDKVVYPMHGAGTIEGIEEKDILGEKQSYYIIKMPGEVKVMVPTAKAEGIGVRDIIDKETAGKVFKVLETDSTQMDMNWNKRYRDNMEKMKSGDIYEVADVVMEKVLSDLPIEAGKEIAVMVNGLGGTPLEELFVVYNRISQILNEKGIKAYMPHIGEFATSMEMAGLSVSIMKLDEQLKELMADPANTPFYTNHNK